MSSLDVFVVFSVALAMPSFFSRPGVLGGGGGVHGHQQTLCFICHKSIDLRHGTIKSHNVELFMVGNIEEEVLAHNGQTDEAEITTGSDPRRSADIDAGQTGATVSPELSSI